MPDFCITVRGLLLERNDIETIPFLSIHEANAFLLNQVDFLQGKCDVADRELGSLRTELALTASKPGTLAASAAIKNEARLRDKLDKLQDEYNAKLKAGTQDKEFALETAQRLSQQQDLVAVQELQLQQLQEELNQKDITILLLDERLLESKQSTRLAEQQYEGLKNTIRQLQSENEGLQKESRALEQRLVTDKEKIVEEMNNLTELADSLKRELDMLKSLKAQEQERSIGWLGKDSTPQSPANRKEDGSRKFGESGVIIPSKIKQNIVAHTIEGTCVRYDPSGTGLLASASSDATVKIWDVNHGQLRGTLRGSPGSSIIGCDLSNTHVVGAGSDKTCRVWDIRTQRMIHHLVGHAHKITCVKLYGRDKYVLTGSADRCMKVWDISLKTYKQTLTLRHSSTSNCIDVAPDSTTAMSGHLDGGLRFWDLMSGERTLDLPGIHEAAVTSVRFHPLDNMLVLTNAMDSSLKVIDIRNGLAVHTLRHPDFRTSHNWSSAAFSPDGRYVVAGSNSSGHVFVWGATDGSLKSRLEGHQAGVCAVDWGCTSQQVASVDRKGNLILWA
jgi:autophagy-related protein 16